MSKVIFYTPAYNAEKLLHRSVDSVLSQTHADFAYYLLDNASTDRTYEIIKEYGVRDKRIIPLHNEINWRGNSVIDVIKNHSDDCYFCELDADDEYTPDFLEKMITFVKENRLDVATCGTDWIEQETGRIMRHKVLNENIILEGQEFARQFPIYRNFMVTLWGGIYSLNVLRRCDFHWYHYALNFSDTGFCMEAFRRANRAGVVAESLHKYNVSSTTDSYKYNPKWFLSCKNLIEITREYILDYGKISKRNEDYLCVLYLILIKYILPRIQNACVDLSEKLNSLNEIFNDEMTLYILKHWSEVGIDSDKGEFLREINDWIISQDGWELDRSKVGRIISFVNISGGVEWAK